MIKDWKDIHEDFAKKASWSDKTYQQEWKEKSFTFEEAKKWISIGFKPQYLSWIQQWKEYNFSLEKTKQWIEGGFGFHDASHAKEWKESDFIFDELKQLIEAKFKAYDCKIAKEWRKQKFTIPQILTWINVGLKPNEHEFANYLREKNYFPNNHDIIEIIQKESWQDIHPSFDYRQRNNWEKEAKINHAETKKWMKLGFKFNESDRVKEWKERGLDYLAAEQLISAGLDNQYSWNNWKKLGFTIQQTREWMKVGLSQWEYDLANHLRSRNYQPMNLNIKKLREEHEKLQSKQPEALNELSQEVIEQIKDFEHSNNSHTKLTSEQQALIDKLILDPKLKEQYQRYGLCPECRQPNTYSFGENNWCQPCNAQHFAQDFDKWTSGNSEIDKLICRCQLEAINNEQVLEWIPYKRFTNVEYLAEGGFGKVYKAEWIDGYIKNWIFEKKQWKRESSDFHGKKEKEGNKNVVLKILNDSQNTNAEFLQEVANYKLFSGASSTNLEYIVKCFGISQDPQTKSYIMVMDYIPGGNARKYLDNHYNKLSFRDKISQLWTIAKGLKNIHDKKLIHRDFHLGNILNYQKHRCYITDLGLCRPANETDQEKVYGVLPYVAPEVLCSRPYTQASDIYSFGIVAYEILSGSPPYHDIAYDAVLASLICQGLRPNLKDVKLPEPLKDLIEECWNSNLSIRPTANELHKILYNWYWNRNSEFYKRYLITEEEESNNSATFSCQPNPQAVYTSCLLNFKNLPEPQNCEEINKWFYSLLISNDSLDSLELKWKKLTNSNNNSDLTNELDIDTIDNEFSEVMKNLTEKTKRQLSLETQTKTNQGEAKLPKMDEQKEYQSEPMEVDYSINWQSIHTNFNEELTQSWQNLSFTYQQTQDWINIGLQPADYNFAHFLKNIKQKTPEEILNQENLESLKVEFEQYQQHQIQALQVQITNFPPNNK